MSSSIAPPDSSLLGLVSVLAPVIVTGNAAVVVASERRPLPSVVLSEVLATSDVPPGVVNVLTGQAGELAPVAAGHMDVNAIDLTGAPAATGPTLERAAAAKSQAGLPRRGGLGRPARHRPDAGHARDQDRLAPGRHLTAGLGSAA